MWSVDNVIDSMNLDESSRQTPSLHAKYIRIYSEEKMRLVSLEKTQKKLLLKKWLYYNGKMDQESIEKLGWAFDPFNGLKVLKGEMDYYYNADDDIQKSELRIDLQKEIISTLKEIVENLKWRHQTINNMIKFRMFQAGG